MTNVSWTDKDFAVMSGPQLVAWWNDAVRIAQQYQMISYKPIQKFESREMGIKRCALLASSLRAAKSGEEAVAARDSGQAEEDVVAKKAKVAKKANGEKKPRSGGKPCKPAAEMKTIRTGTDRYRVLSLVDGKRTLSRIAELAEMKPGYVRQHLHVANRDVGVGYSISADEVVELKFPGSKGLADYTKQPAA